MMNNTTTPLSIVNGALSEIGINYIVDLNDSDNFESVRASKAYHDKFNYLLEEYDWTFSIRRVRLDNYIDTEGDDRRKFQLPFDFNKISYLRPRLRGEELKEYSLEGRSYVLINKESGIKSLSLDYSIILSEIELDSVPQNFIEALKISIAMNLAPYYALPKLNQVLDRLNREYRARLSIAVRKNTHNYRKGEERSGFDNFNDLVI